MNPSQTKPRAPAEPAAEAMAPETTRPGTTGPDAKSVQALSVIVPDNPFLEVEEGRVRQCLAALDVVDLMRWWPGTPHSPHRDAAKVRAIQRSLDWKRVAQIAAYLLQREIVDAPRKVREVFEPIYGHSAEEPGREWPPRVPKVVRFERSEYRAFSSVLVHVNGPVVKLIEKVAERNGRTAELSFNEQDAGLKVSVIDGQHRINGAYLAVQLLRQTKPDAKFSIPAEVFIDLDAPGQPPRRQARIFIDVNYYQKRVDRSLAADLFPTARGRDALDDKERAQDLGRRLMLEVGPLVGMIQVPGIKYGVPGVVALATLDAAIQDVLPHLKAAGVESLEGQTEFLAMCLDAWLNATGRKEELDTPGRLTPDNVAYQGRVIVSFMTLIPECILELRRRGLKPASPGAGAEMEKWLRSVMRRARLIKNRRFLPKSEFQAKGFLGSGGLARFRDTLWAATASPLPPRLSKERVAELASRSRARAMEQLGSSNER